MALDPKDHDFVDHDEMLDAYLAAKQKHGTLTFEQWIGEKIDPPNHVLDTPDQLPINVDMSEYKDDSDDHDDDDDDDGIQTSAKLKPKTPNLDGSAPPTKDQSPDGVEQLGIINLGKDLRDK